jgi:hypothetical protein
MEPATLRIVVAPTSNCGFSASLGDRPLIKSARCPLIEAARALLREGRDPATTLEMQHKGSAIVAMRGRIGLLAQMRVSEGAIYCRSDDTPPENPDSSRRPSAYKGHSAAAANTLAPPSKNQPKVVPTRISPIPRSSQETADVP